MCLSKAFIERNGDRELLLEEIASVEVGDNSLLLKTLFGEQKTVKARIREVDFMTHSILLRNLEEGADKSG
jgi:predicted RNA-binding protein